MAEAYTILIADRNRNIRELLEREMKAEGFRVRLAKSAGEVLKCIYNAEPVDLVILDLDLPDAKDMAILDRIEDRIPAIPVVVHAFAPSMAEVHNPGPGTVFVEKAGASIDVVKRAVVSLLSNPEVRGPTGEGGRAGLGEKS